MANINNPLLSKVKLPGRVFQLPSKGIFYPPGNVLATSVKDGEIQVKPMSALAEMKIRSGDLLLSGKIIAEICQECIPEIKIPEALCTRDIDALFLFLVAVTYGSERPIRSIHSCTNAKLHEYVINLDPILMNPNNEVLSNLEALYSVDLPNGQKVKLKPVTFADSLHIVNLQQEMARKERNDVKPSQREVEQLMIDDLLAVIGAVQDNSGGELITVTDRKLIEEWARCLSRKQQEAIIAAAQKSSDWGFKFTATVKCKDCGEEYVHDLDLNPVNFFSG